MAGSAAQASAPSGRAAMGARHRWLRVGGWLLALLVLLAVFAAYLQPAMAFQLAQQLWACF
jgi:hypothetical protein